MGNYHWARATVRSGWLTIAELGLELRLSTWQARRLLKRSKLPCRLYTRYWKGPDGHVYRRKVWAIPPETVDTLWAWRLNRFTQIMRRYSDRIQGSLRAEARRRGDQAGLEWLRGLSVSRPQLPDLRMPLT